MKKRKGFTLVELVIVIAVIAILSAVLVPTFAGILERARESTRIQRATNIRDEYLSQYKNTISELDGYVFVVEGKNYVCDKNGEINYHNGTIEDIQKENSVYYDEIVFGGITIYEPTTDAYYGYPVMVGNNGYTWEEAVSNGLVTVTEEWEDYFILSSVDSSVSRIEIDGSIYEIGENAFLNNTNLEFVKISDSVSMLREYCFAGCTNLKSITIPQTVYSIAEYSFYGCNNLEYMTLPFVGETLYTQIGMGSVLGYIFGHSEDWSEGITYQEYMNYDGWVSSEYFFIPKSLKEITITSQELTTLNQYAFNGISTLEKITIPQSIQTIGNGAFKDCYNLSTLNMGDNILVIGDYAFRNCNAFETVPMPNTVTQIGSYAYSFLNKKNIVLPDTLESLGNNVFEYNNFIMEIEIPESVTTIGSNIFNGCEKLVRVLNKSQVDNSVISYGIDNIGFEVSNDENFVNTLKTYNDKYLVYTINNESDENYQNSYIMGFVKEGETSAKDISNLGVNITGIYAYAFYEYKTLEEITLTDSINYLGKYSFASCEKLKSIHIVEEITNIPEGAFQNCTSLKEITFAEGTKLKTMEGYAFGYCTALIEVELPEGLQSYGWAFAYCSSLTTVSLPSTLTENAAESFVACYRLVRVVNKSTTTNSYDLIWFNLGSYPRSVSVEAYTEKPSQFINTITYGEKYVTYKINDTSDMNYGKTFLMGFTDLSDTVVDNIPSDVTDIYQYAFCESKITSVTLTNNIKSIGQCAFTYSYNLKSVNIPSSVEIIDDQAFWECTKLDTLKFEGESTLKYLGRSAFENTNLSNIEVPSTVEFVGQSSLNTTGEQTYTTYENGKYIGNKDNPYVVLMEVIDKSVSTFTIHENTRAIYAQSMQSMSNLTTLVIPNSVRYIGDAAISDCENLEEITLSNNLMYIEGSAFSSTGFRNLTIPSTVIYIGRAAFVSSSLSYATFEDVNYWYCVPPLVPENYTEHSSESLSNTSTAAYYLDTTYVYQPWYKLPNGIESFVKF